MAKRRPGDKPLSEPVMIQFIDAYNRGQRYGITIVVVAVVVVIVVVVIVIVIVVVIIVIVVVIVNIVVVGILFICHLC